MTKRYTNVTIKLTKWKENFSLKQENIRKKLNKLNILSNDREIIRKITDHCNLARFCGLIKL